MKKLLRKILENVKQQRTGMSEKDFRKKRHASLTIRLLLTGKRIRYYTYIFGYRIKKELLRHRKMLVQGKSATSKIKCHVR